MDIIKTNISNKFISLKSELGNLIDLVENWILSLKFEEERKNRLESLLVVINRLSSVIPSNDYKACKEHLEAILNDPNFLASSSKNYREKLYNLFKNSINKINYTLDNIFSEINCAFESFEATIKDPTTGIIITQEEERKRIAREIHDGPAQMLANIVMHIDNCLQILNKPEHLKQELEHLKITINKSLVDLRRYIFDLRPMALDDLGLIPTLEQFISGCKSRTTSSINLTIEGNRISLPNEYELAIFRVIQEAVNNAIKHSDAKNIKIHLFYNLAQNLLIGVIKDDGIGFDVNSIKSNYKSLSKLGLISMEERIRYIGGSFEIISIPSEGTIVTFKVPLSPTDKT